MQTDDHKASRMMSGKAVLIDNFKPKRGGSHSRSPHKISQTEFNEPEEFGKSTEQKYAELKAAYKDLLSKHTALTAKMSFDQKSTKTQK